MTKLNHALFHCGTPVLSQVQALGGGMALQIREVNRIFQDQDEELKDFSTVT